MPPPPTFDTAKIHLHVLGQDRELDFQVRVGPSTLRDLLPTAREISGRVAAIAIEHAEAEGKKVSCQAGCGACCRQLVPISVVEARSLAEVVSAMPPTRRAEIRRRFKAAIQRLEKAGLLDPRAKKGRQALLSTAAPGESGFENVSKRYFAAQIACPFLEAESCSIYADRPLVCREYNAVTPAAWCSELSPRVETAPRPARMSEVLAEAANAIAGTDYPCVPLTLSLEWSEAHGHSLAGTRDGEAMFWALLDHMETETPPAEKSPEGG
ncbi:MAG: YkgJ family cysteine cluster protein [Minicystis sp.]